MNTNTLHVQLTGHARTTANLESVTTAADLAVWRSAAEVLRERTYAAEDGSVRVQVDWDALVMRDHAVESPVQFEVRVSGANERDVASYAAWRRLCFCCCTWRGMKKTSRCRWCGSDRRWRRSTQAPRRSSSNCVMRSCTASRPCSIRSPMMRWMRMSMTNRCSS